MINPKIIEYIFSSASIQRWNDYPRMVDLVELDKQAHKFIIAYIIAKLEDDINFTHLIEAGIFEILDLMFLEKLYNKNQKRLTLGL